MSSCSSRRLIHLLASIMMLNFLYETAAGFCLESAGKRRASLSFQRPPAPPLLPLHHGDGTTTTTTSSTRPMSITSEAAGADDNSKATGWRAQLLKASDIASLLCVLDCTILPVVTVVLPFFGLVAASPAQMEHLHQLGHSVALWFVLPVGGSATLLNYLYAHKQKRIAALGVLGLMMILAANAPHDLLHSVQHGMLALLYPLLHAAHHGITHRLVNIMGCACLLASNYLSKKSGKCLHGHDHSECGSDSGHSHASHHDHDH